MSATDSNGNGHVGSNGKSTRTKKEGGITGKGFQKGKSGNPSGRPKHMAVLGEAIRAFLSKHDPKDKANRTRLDCLIEGLYKEDPKTLLAYAFGKPVEMVQLADAEGQPVEFRIALTPPELT